MLSNIVVSAIAFLIALGILISIHEYGHFWVARKVGIKVLTYSLGFGRPLWRRTGKVDNTEFVVAAIPLGGYVKMLDEREGTVLSHEKHRAFNNKPLWARTLVVIAGPAANFILAIFAYWIVMMMGISGIAPIVGDVPEGTPAARAGFQLEDKILSINGRSTDTWTDARITLIDEGIDRVDPIPIEVETGSGGSARRLLDVSSASLLDTEADPFELLGLNIWRPPIDAVVGAFTDGSAAEKAGLQVGDEIIGADNKPVTNFSELIAIVHPNAGSAIDFSVLRDGRQLNFTVTPKATERNGQTIGLIGIAPNRPDEAYERLSVKVKYAPLEALGKAFQRTYDMTTLTLQMLVKLVVGEASLDNISGPLSIAQFAGQSASVGLDHYINFIALISLSLAVLNLMPIPMLDGGHLVYFAVEGITGRPVSERVQIWGQQLGIVLLGALMFLAFYNDIGRFLQ